MQAPPLTRSDSSTIDFRGGGRVLEDPSYKIMYQGSYQGGAPVGGSQKFVNGAMGGTQTGPVGAKKVKQQQVAKMQEVSGRAQVPKKYLESVQCMVAVINCKGFTPTRRYVFFY